MHGHGLPPGNAVIVKHQYKKTKFLACLLGTGLNEKYCLLLR
jgi:hypothetical protein